MGENMQAIGKFFIVAGALAVLLGLVLLFFDKLPYLGKLPGDISIKKENFQLYVPITTSVIISVLISVILWIFSHFKGR